MNSMTVLLKVLLNNFIKRLQIISSSLLKISLSKIFVLFLVFLGTMFILVPKHKEAHKSNKLLYTIGNNAAPSKKYNNNGANYFAEKINDRYVKDIRVLLPDNYIILGMFGKTKKLDKFVNKSLVPNKLAQKPKFIGTDGKVCPPTTCVTQPVITGYACPTLVYTRPFMMFFPPPVVVVARTTPAAPPGVPIPESKNTA